MSEHFLQLAPPLVTLKPLQICCGAVASVVLAIFLVKMTRKSLNYPPGPPRDPILGNARQMAGNYIELKLTEWGERYGIFYLFSVRIRALS